VNDGLQWAAGNRNVRAAARLVAPKNFVLAPSVKRKRMLAEEDAGARVIL